MLKIITTDADPQRKSTLYQKACEVTLPLSEVIIERIAQMCEFYKTVEDKGGFAAPQVGFADQIILVEHEFFAATVQQDTMDEESVACPTNEPVILINPVWEPASNKQAIDIEGCLSVLDKVGFVMRYVDVILKAWRYCPVSHELVSVEHQYSNDYSCALWQHEIDHLYGVIFTDKAELLLERQDFIAMRQYLVTAGKLYQGMQLFEIAAVVYQLAIDWKNSGLPAIEEFLKKISIEPSILPQQSND